jgi:hypothetical protein
LKFVSTPAGEYKEISGAAGGEIALDDVNSVDADDGGDTATAADYAGQ